MLITPSVESLAAIVAEMRTWSFDADKASLHVGDVGWNQQFGAPALASALRLWRLGDRLAAVGLLDEPELLRLAVAPELQHDEDFIHQLVGDLTAADGRVLPAGEVALEARFVGPLHDRLLAQGWEYDEAWTPLVRDLSGDVPLHHLRIEDVDPDRLDDRLAVHHAAFERSTFTAERWHALTQGPAYANARSLVGYDDGDNAVAMVTVWATGAGGPASWSPWACTETTRAAVTVGRSASQPPRHCRTWGLRTRSSARPAATRAPWRPIGPRAMRTGPGARPATARMRRRP